ncbi:hypothetical protein BDR26DRAFT_862383 [Obelidium mucronatum]|nr:hypothetical protein BDR26DRAFT_862383 [Obelidium mucronatum]
MHNNCYDPSDYWSIHKVNTKVLSMSAESAQGYAQTRLSHRPTDYRFRLKRCPILDLPSTISLIPGLTTIDFHGAHLSGTLPLSIFDCASLELLYLGGNNFTGPIPKEIGNLTQLKRLMIFSNKLTGSIPPEFGKLVNLEYCNMELNAFTGDIPPEIGGLVSVIVLRIHVQSNGVFLSYPASVSNLKNLVSCAYKEGYDICRPSLPDNHWVHGYNVPKDDDDSDESGESDMTDEDEESDASDDESEDGDNEEAI